MTQTLKINGAERQFPEGTLPETLKQLLDRLDINEATVVAEVDGDIVERKNFAATVLRPGQTIELVRFVGGG